MRKRKRETDKIERRMDRGERNKKRVIPEREGTVGYLLH